MRKPVRIAYLVSHPIQYQAPLLRRLAQEPGVHLTVFFCSDVSTKPHVDQQFGKTLSWDVPLLDGYEHDFLPSLGDRERVTFWRPWNHGLFTRLRAGRFDVLWIHGYNRFLHWVAMAQAKALGIKILIRDESTLMSNHRGPLKRAAKRLFFSVLKRVGDGFLAIGSRNREHHMHYGIPSERIFSVPYAVDNDFFRARASAAATSAADLRRELGLEPGRPVILYVGKLMARKRADELLEAYERLSVAGAEPAPYLVFVGEGELRARLEERVRRTGWSSVKLVGFKNQTELPAFYALCDMFVMTSVREAWGLVVNEVMNAGKPIVCSDEVGCASDLVKDGENGFLYKPGDVDGLAAAMHSILEDPRRREAMGRRSLEIIERWGFEEDVAGVTRAIEVAMEPESSDGRGAAGVGAVRHH